jgi:dolichol kinase
VHLLNGCAIAAALYLLKPVVGMLVLAPLLVAIVLLLIIPKHKPDLTVANHLMYHFERKKDIKNFPFKGAIHYGVGIIFPILLLDVYYGCAVILVLSVGDSISTLVGRRYGRIRIGEKTLEGSVAFWASSFLATAALVPAEHAIMLASAGTLIELSGIYDDNITIPVGLSMLSYALVF